MGAILQQKMIVSVVYGCSTNSATLYTCLIILLNVLAAPPGLQRKLVSQTLRRRASFKRTQEARLLKWPASNSNSNLKKFISFIHVNSYHSVNLYVHIIKVFCSLWVYSAFVLCESIQRLFVRDDCFLLVAS